MPYKIPKGLFPIKTIKTNNGTLEGKTDDQGNMYWFKNGKYITPSVMKNYRYYDSEAKAYRQLGKKAKMHVDAAGIIDFKGVDNPIYTPFLDRLYSESERKDKVNNKRENEQSIPLQGQNWITLKTKGKMNLVDIPENMLDSIAVNAGRSNTDFWTDMGLVGKESTFVGFSKALGYPYHEDYESAGVHEMTNNHAWFNTPEGDYRKASFNKFNHRDDAQLIKAEEDAKYALEHGLVKATTPIYSKYILADAFKRYQVAPTQYNPGQKNYVPMLNDIRQELQGEKQLQQYWNTRGKQEYARGQKEGMAYGGFLQPKDAWDSLSLPEQAAMMKVAVKNGIYDLPTIRQKYNEFAEGGDTDWSYNSWKKQIAEYMGIRPDEDNTYDYEAFFKKYPEEAWRMLKGDPTAHFSDEFKTVYHPTFSSKSVGNDGSIYSGVRNSKTNPQGLVGGTWSPDYHTFTMSPDGYRGPVSMDDRKWYLENAEDNGVQLREVDGSLPVYDGIPWGGVLPNVTIYGNKHSIGGPLVEAAMNEYANGGGIHIKPSHRGRLTALKKRTGKTEAELYNDGNPAHKKMVVFARNSRKWKHGLGGDLNTYNYGNTFGGGGLFGNETVDTVASFLPIVGTAEDAYQFYKDPSWANAGWLALSLGSDIFTGGMAARGIKALRMANKAHDAAQVANRAARRTWEAGKAANTAQSGSVKGADMRRMINSVKAAGATRQAAIKRVNDALFEAGVATGVDQGLNGFINAAQMDLLPDFGSSYEQKHGNGGNLFDGNSQPTQKMRRASDYRYILDDDGEWNRVTNDEMGRVFQGLTVTPVKTKQKFVPERIDNSLEAAKTREKFFQYRDEEGHVKGEPGLEIVSPEFEILTGARMAMPTYSQQAIKNYQVGRAMKLQPKNMPKVNKAFRSEEWGNFLNTRNGDNYYRMVNIEKETANGYSPKENYFVSHTTPWEEFSGMKGIEDPAMIGKNLPTFHNRLYEFPSKTFGTRKSSSWKGVLGDTNVDVMGKNHLYYGDTSSGVRGPVRVISDTNADYLGVSPYKIGITDRPLKINGLYDTTPVYEDIYMGNQTVLNGRELQEAIQNSTYNIFDHTPLFFMGKDATPSGITKIIHINK